jgi:lipoprotein-anchoring transpeptidase ErfK/SrfK
LVVSTSEQVLRVFENGTLTHTYPVSTAEAGNGQLSNSYQTPLGLHKVSKKIGSGAEPKTIFRARQNTGKKWTPANTSKEDLVLTRILWLEGLEPGFNKGRNARGDLVDSMKRYIYIHGTNDEKAIGRPASKGCVRMETNNLMEVYQETPTGTLVWIEE